MVVLAWIVIALVVIFVGLPIVGSCFTGYGSKYSDDLMIGLCMVLVLMCLCAALGAVMWAFSVAVA